jgi:hypothetical protein
MIPARKLIFCLLILLVAVPAAAQLPRSVFVEFGTATW